GRGPHLHPPSAHPPGHPGGRLHPLGQHDYRTPSFFSTASAAASADWGFWAVMRFRSTTTCDTQGDDASSKTAPAFLRALSRYQAMPFWPIRVWSSSSSLNEVSRYPSKSHSPLGPPPADKR